MENINLLSKKKWVKVKLGDIANTITKGSTPTTYGFIYLDKGIPFIKIENIENDKISHRSIKQFISNEAHEYQSRSQLQEGDILFSIAGTIGKTCVVTKNDIPSNTNQALSIIRGTNKCLLPKFLKLQFLSILSTAVKKKARGGAMSNISLSDLKKMDILLPSIREQNRIVEKIEELFSDLDKATEDLKKTQEQLKIYRQAVLKAAFEGKLTKEWRKKNISRLAEEVLKIKNENIDELFKIPKSWKWLKILHIGEVETGTTPRKNVKSNYGDDYPFYKPTDLEAGINVRNAREYLSVKGLKKARFLPINSILVTCIGATIGKTGIIRLPGASNQQINAIIPYTFTNPDFIYYQVVSPYFQEQIISKSSSTTLPILNKSRFKELLIIIATKEEQEQILQEIESRLSVCDKVEKTVEQNLNKIKYLRQSISKKAFEGKLVPQNPNDEPAEKLLERIKQEKEKFEFNNKKRKTI